MGELISVKESYYSEKVGDLSLCYQLSLVFV